MNDKFTHLARQLWQYKNPFPVIHHIHITLHGNRFIHTRAYIGNLWNTLYHGKKWVLYIIFVTCLSLYRPRSRSLEEKHTITHRAN